MELQCIGWPGHTFVVLILLVELVDCTLISKSILERCITGSASEPKGGNGKTCSKKFVVSVTLKSGQVRALGNSHLCSLLELFNM